MGIGNTNALFQPNLVTIDPTSQALVDAGGNINPFASASSRYRFFIPGQQFIGSGSAKDKSVNSGDAALMASLTDAAAWANPSYMTTQAGANRGFTIPAAKVQFDLATQSIIFSASIKKVASVGSEAIFGCADTGSAQGFYLSQRALSGGVSKVRPILNTSGGVVSALADSLATFGEASATDHVITLAIDGLTKGVFLWCDGTLSNSYASAFTGGTTVTSAFGIGSSSGNSGVTMFAQQCSGLHLLAITGGLPINMNMIAQQLAAIPHNRLSDADFQF
jgi:hypothetical protein